MLLLVKHHFRVIRMEGGGMQDVFHTDIKVNMCAQCAL